jgi:hypothetical protein
MSLRRRLRSLEHRSGSKCPECGLSPDAPAEDYEVRWHDTEGADPEGADPTPPEFCETCGRQVVFVGGWGNIEPIGTGEGRS